MQNQQPSSGTQEAHHQDHDLYNQAMLYRDQVEQAYANGLISASQYQNAMSQLSRAHGSQNEAHGYRHKRKNSSTGGPAEAVAADMSMQSRQSLAQTHNIDQSYHGSHHQHQQVQRPQTTAGQISNFQLANMAANLSAQLNGQGQNARTQLQSTADLQNTLSQYNMQQTGEPTRQTASSRGLAGQQAKTHRVQSQSGSNSSAMYRYSNLQNFNIKQRSINTGNENSEVKPKQPQANMSSRHSFQNPGTSSFGQARQAKSQSRADSTGPAPGVQSNGALHSSGGSMGAYSFRRESGILRSRTQNTVNMTNIMSMIACPCHQKNKATRHQSLNLRSKIKAHLGCKQPILQSTENTANCGQCGQFYAIKDNHYTGVTQSGKKQVGSQAMIIKTVREKDINFKLDEPVAEIFNRMRQVSLKVIENLQPHPFYLSKRVKRIDNLSYIADALQSDNQTIHHAVLLMDIYSSKVSKSQDYDTLLISLCCLLISTKYLQIKYPGADTLNDMVKRKYNADLIIHMEGVVLDIIDWNLMVYSIYDYVKLFVSQGCLFDNEEVLKQHGDEILDDSTIRERPSVKLAEHFKKYAEFFADFCMYQECFMTSDPYLLACAIVAYTRKYMCVAIIWPSELELLTQCSFNHFKNLYLIIESKYTENFPNHARSQNISNQLLTEPHQQTAQCSMRKNIMNQLQLSSGGKTQKTQNSSNKPGNFNNILGDLKTPDKFVFDFNSIVSGNKTHEKFSHEKFQINSNSVEKFRLQNNKPNTKAVTTDQTSKVQGVIFSDNKKQSINAHSFKKIIMKNQVTNNLSDEKQTQVHQSLLKNYHEGMQNKRELAKAQQNDNREYLSQNHTQNISASIMNSVTSPSANINETENEQEVPPFKPMIIKSNSQAIGGGFECKTTTKKSPSGVDLEKINALKEAMNHVNIQAKMPSSTTNKSMKLNIHGSLNDKAAKNAGNIFSNKNITSSYGAIGVNNGPIKINQKIKIVNGSNQKSSQNTGQKSQGMTSSSKKMKVSKTFATSLKGTNLSNQYYQERLAEQREQRQRQQDANRKPDNRNASCISHNQKATNPHKNYSYISGKPKANLGAHVYDKNPANQAIASEGSANQYGSNNPVPQRSVLSIKNAAHVIKRKSSYHQNQQQTVDLRVNIKQNLQQKQTQPSNAHIVPHNMVKAGKNLPNGLLRKATDGAQGKQKSIGALSNYMGGATAATAQQINNSLQQANQDAVSLERTNPNNHLMSYDSDEQYEKERHHTDIRHEAKGLSNGLSNGSFQNAVNPPAIITGNTGNKNSSQQVSSSHQASLVKNKSFTLGNGHRDSNDGNQALGLSRSAFIKMNQERQSLPSSNGATHRSSQNHASQNYASMPGTSSAEQHAEYSTNDETTKQFKKNNSQVFGKARQRPKVTRGQMLKDLNDKKDKMSQLVEAAHATRCTSNEKGSSTKKNCFEAFGASAHQQKYINSTSQVQSNGAHPAPLVSSFNLMAGGSSSHSREREGQFASSSFANNENVNAMNIGSSNLSKPNFINQSSISHKNQMGLQRQSFLSQHSSQVKQQQTNSQKLASFRV